MFLFIEQISKLDREFFIFLNGFHSPFWDSIMWAVSGKYLWIPLYAIILFQIIKKNKIKSVLIILFIILQLVLSDQVSNNLIKNIFHRLRPCHDPQLAGIVHILNNYCGGQFGFVSSHAANTFAFATFIVLLFRNRLLTLFMFFWAGIVSYSRIYLGVHYPADVICGALTGAGIALLLFPLYKFSEKKMRAQVASSKERKITP